MHCSRLPEFSPNKHGSRTIVGIVYNANIVSLTNNDYNRTFQEWMGNLFRAETSYLIAQRENFTYKVMQQVIVHYEFSLQTHIRMFL